MTRSFEQKRESEFQWTKSNQRRKEHVAGLASELKENLPPKPAYADDSAVRKERKNKKKTSDEFETMSHLIDVLPLTERVELLELLIGSFSAKETWSHERRVRTRRAISIVLPFLTFLLGLRVAVF